MRNDIPQFNPGGPGRFIGGVFGFVFLGVGLTVLGFLWLTPFNQFGSPPLFFRIIGSFVATAFVATGGGFAYAAITGKLMNPASRFSSFDQASKSSDMGAGSRYVCDKCAAPLADGADVSPSGDVKCSHCGSWFNVHAR